MINDFYANVSDVTVIELVIKTKNPEDVVSKINSEKSFNAHVSSNGGVFAVKDRFQAYADILVETDLCKEESEIRTRIFAIETEIEEDIKRKIYSIVDPDEIDSLEISYRISAQLKFNDLVLEHRCLEFRNGKRRFYEDPYMSDLNESNY